MKVVDVFRCGVLKDYRTWDREGGRGWCSVCRALPWRRSATVEDPAPPRPEDGATRSKERRARIEVIALSDGGAPGEERYPSIVPVMCPFIYRSCHMCCSVPGQELTSLSQFLLLGGRAPRLPARPPHAAAGPPTATPPSETVTVVPCDRETRWPLSTTDVSVFGEGKKGSLLDANGTGGRASCRDGN